MRRGGSGGKSPAGRVLKLVYKRLEQQDHQEMRQQIRLGRAFAGCGCASLVCEDVIRRSGAMGQLTFFDAEKRLAALSEKGDPLEAIAALVL